MGTCLRLVCVLLLAVLASAPVGLALNALASELHCEGERLACNIDVAIGAYATIMVAVLGPLIYGVTLVVATNDGPSRRDPGFAHSAYGGLCPG